MKRTLIFIMLLTLALGNTIVAGDAGKPEGQVSVNAVRRSQVPRILPGNRAAFEVKAPEAKKVQLDLGRLYDMTRDDNGVWRCVTDSLMPGFHYYFLVVDGARVADPASESFFGCGVMASGLEVPYAEGDKRFELADVPHGEVVQRRYHSSVDNADKRMFIYTPPGYNSSTDRYPVLYLQHGGGEDERGWSQQGRTDIIMDNLIAQGKAVPMIIVMSDGNSRDFTEELIKECIPLVESNYRVIAGPEGRAIAGLSMGGIHALNAAITHPELFSNLGVFSSGWWATSAAPGGMGNDTEKYYDRIKKDTDYFNRQFRNVWISMGGKEDIA
ncbi:alpha/beta hydrolase-fold protein, partial [uncultured Muribaculum sp.]